MLNLNCSICTELFSHSDDVHVTSCGHMFHFPCLTKWLDRSKTCPQCRNKCSQRNIFKIYFNLANLDSSHIDVGSLQEQVDNGKLQLQIKENELKKAEEQVKQLKESQKKWMKVVDGLEKKNAEKDFVILSCTEQIKLLKADASNTEALRRKCKNLQDEVSTMSDIAYLLKATNDEAAKILSTEKDPKKLCALLAALQRQLRNCETRKSEIRSALRDVQSDLRKEIEIKKMQEERISELESENFRLTEKIAKLEKYESLSERTSSHALETHSKPSEKDIQNSDTHKHNLHGGAEKVSSEKRYSISPRIREEINRIEDSDSPYLKIKSSSIGLMTLLKRNEGKSVKRPEIPNTTKIATLKISPKKADNSGDKTENNESSGSSDNEVICLTKQECRKRNIVSSSLHKTSSDITEKFSIFKKPRLGNSKAYSHEFGVSRTMSLKPNHTFDGFGGSKRIDMLAAQASAKMKSASGRQ